MSGYKWDPVFRVVPRNGGETVYWLSDRLTDVGSHTKITLRYPESMNIREDINRSLRPVVYGLRPEVEIECLITTMEDQTFLKEIEDALLLPNHYNVFLSLDGGCVEREVVLANVSNAEPIRGKTVIGATFKLAVRCVDLIPRKPAMMTDPLVGQEHLQDGGMEMWSSSSVAVGWNYSGAMTVAQESTIVRSGSYSFAATRTDGVTSAYMQNGNYPCRSLNSGRWYRLRLSARGSVSIAQGASGPVRVIIIANRGPNFYLSSDGTTWGPSGTFLLGGVTSSAFTDFESYLRLPASHQTNDPYFVRLQGYWTGTETLYYDDFSLYGPVLRPGISTW